MKQYPSPEQAKMRWFAIQAIRILGFAAVLIGILFTQGVLSVDPANDDLIGYVLIAIGLLDGFLMPIVLARVWHTPHR